MNVESFHDYNAALRTLGEGETLRTQLIETQDYSTIIENPRNIKTIILFSLLNEHEEILYVFTFIFYQFQLACLAEN